MDAACSNFRYISDIFNELEEFRAFELLRTGLDRSKYLLVKEAKIIAMTCTHAALKRKELVNLGFRYDNILMEESAQILEIETFIPLLLQNPLDGLCHGSLKMAMLSSEAGHEWLYPLPALRWSKWPNRILAKRSPRGCEQMWG